MCFDSSLVFMVVWICWVFGFGFDDCLLVGGYWFCLACCCVRVGLGLVVILLCLRVCCGLYCVSCVAVIGY